MSISMFTALTALRSNQTRLEVISDNISNLNTSGFKTQRVLFADLLAQRVSSESTPTSEVGGINPSQVGMGVRVKSIDPLITQGSLNNTNNPYDFAIEGNGFFVLKDQGQVFTRDGSFQVDSAGNVVHSGTGLRAQGWVADTAGALAPSGATSDLTIPVGLTMDAKATGSASLAGNLDAGAATGTTYTMSLQVFDSLGTAHMVDLAFTKSATNSWNWTGTSGGGSAGSGTLTFDTSGRTAGTGTLNLPVTGGGATPLTVTLELSPLTQLASASSVSMTNQDGFPPGGLQGISTNTNGVLTGLFTNGRTRVLGQFALGLFNNPSALLRTGNNQFQLSGASGVANIGEAGTQGRGQIRSGMLEQSNVDLANELTQVLVTQRNFQAAARLITTSDEMAQEIISIRR